MEAASAEARPSAGTDEPPPAAPHRVTPIRAAWVAGVVVVLAFLVNAAPWVAGPLGNSHDGRNAGVWAASGQALRTDPIGSRLGGINRAGVPYANHPPAIVLASAVTTGLTGDHPLGVRLPAVIASAATVALLGLLLVRMGFGWFATASGIVLAGTAPIFLAYGTMLDTPMLGLPAAAAVLVLIALVQRNQAPPPWAFVVVGLLCGLTSWQTCITAAVGGALLLLERATRRSRVRGVAALAAGTVLGVAISLAWAWWAYGGLDLLLDSYQTRTTGSAAWWNIQRLFLRDGYGPIRIAIVVLAVVVALVRRRHRIVLVTALAAPIVWDVRFRLPASIHDYWTYGGILAVGVAAAIVVELAVDLVRRFAPRLEWLVVVSVVGLFGAAAVTAWVSPSTSEQFTRAGLDAGALTSDLPQADDPDEVVVYALSSIPGPIGWAAWETGGTAETVTADDLPELARTHPDALVLVNEAFDDLTPEVQAATVSRKGTYRLVRAEAFAD